MRRVAAAILLCLLASAAWATIGLPWPGPGLTNSGLPPYTTTAVVFDGSNDWLTRGADLTGNADGKKGILSCWLNFQGADSVAQRLIQNGSSGTTRLTISKTASNKISVAGLNAAAAIILTLTSTTSYTTASGWINILACWDLSAGVGYLYVNNVDDLAGGSTLTNDTIDYTTANWSFGGYVDGTGRMTAYASDCYINLAETIDLSVGGNRQKFVTTGAKPVNLGAGGATPTGTQPIVFFKGTDANYQTNLGTGGAFAVNGTLTNAPTSPSD